MNRTESIGGAGGVSARSTRLQREMAAARRALARPASPVDEVLEAVAAKLLSELSGPAAPTGHAPPAAEMPIVRIPQRGYQHSVQHPAHN